MRKATNNSKVTIMATALCALVPAVVSPHPGAEAHSAFLVQNGFLVGLAHPFTRIDHLLAMFAVGLWSTRLARRAGIGVMAMFIALMLAGAVAARAGLAIPMVEPAVATSVIVMGLLALLGARLPAAVVATAAMVLALLYGYAHGAELQQFAGFVDYFAEFSLASMTLIATGNGLGVSRRDGAKAYYNNAPPVLLRRPHV